MVSSLHLLEFETLHNYGREKDRIEVPVTLRSGERSVSFPAQLDTGATYCVFEAPTQKFWAYLSNRARFFVSPPRWAALTLTATP